MKLICIFVLLALLGLGGCQFLRHPFGQKKKEEAKKIDVPPPPIDWAVVWLAIGGVVGIGAGVALAIILPGDDHIPYGIVGGGGAVLGLALVLKAVQVMLVWGCVAAIVVGLAWVGWRIYKRKSVENLMSVTT